MTSVPSGVVLLLLFQYLDDCLSSGILTLPGDVSFLEFDVGVVCLDRKLQVREAFVSMSFLKAVFHLCEVTKSKGCMLLGSQQRREEKVLSLRVG